MSQLSVAVEAVDKRLERLRGASPADLNELQSLLEQYQKATEALVHAKNTNNNIFNPDNNNNNNNNNRSRSNSMEANKFIDQRLETIALEQLKLLDLKQKLLDSASSFASSSSASSSFSSSSTSSSSISSSSLSSSSSMSLESSTISYDHTSTTSSTNNLNGSSGITSRKSSAPHFNDINNNNNNNDNSDNHNISVISQGRAGMSPMKSPMKTGTTVLTNRMGSRSSMQYQSWAGNLVYRRTPVSLPKMQRLATHRSLQVSGNRMVNGGLLFFHKRQMDALGPVALRMRPSILEMPHDNRKNSIQQVTPTQAELKNSEDEAIPASPLLVNSSSPLPVNSLSPPKTTIPISPLLLSTVIADLPAPAPRLSELQKVLRLSELAGPAERKVQNEITDMISAKSLELYDLLWVVRLQDRAVSRILNVQVDISELHTILPESTGLAVACVPQSVQQPLRTVVSTLRTRPAILADTLLRAGYLALDQDRSFKSTHYELSQAITFSLFGNCVNPADEKLFLYLLRRITKSQLSVAPTSHLFGKHESFALTLFSTYMNCTYGKPYLICTFKDLIASVLQEDSLNFESDPQKKSFLDPSFEIARNLDDPPDNQMMLQYFAALFSKRITVRLTPLPYGIRWFAKSIIELWRARLAAPTRSPSAYRHSPTVTSPPSPAPFATTPTTPHPALNPSSVEWKLLCHVVIENIFVPTIIRPEHFGVASGLPISHRRRSNLILIARMVLDFFMTPSTIPADLHHVINEEMISSYFAALTQVDDPDTHLRSDSQEHNSVLISSTDLVLLLELVFQNQTCDTNFMQLVQVVQPAVAELQEGMQFVVVEVGNDEIVSDISQPSSPNPSPRSKDAKQADNSIARELLSSFEESPARRISASTPLVMSPSAPSVSSMASSAPTPPSPAILSDAALVRAAKQNLRLALSVLDPICGPTHLPSSELLLLQCGRNLSFDAHVMEAHISETIRCMAALPQRYREDNYRLLLMSMFEDHAAQQRAQEERKQGFILHLNSTQRHIAQLQAQKRMNIELLTDIKFKQFRDKIYGRMQAAFINEFHEASTTVSGSSNCSCYPSIHPNKNVVCAKCKVKVELVKAFLVQSRETLSSSIWWKYSNEEEVQVAMHTLERNLFVHIHAWVFAVSKEDEKFASNLRKKSSSVTMDDVLINPKFHTQAPWSLAQEEIKKINIYKSPHDKVQSIIGCWNIIFTYTRPFGDDTGPDDYLPILAYVIIKSQPLHLLSNLQYILLYTNLDPSDEVWVVNFLSAVELVREVTEGDLAGHAWMNGVVEPSFLFPSLPIPSERPRKLLRKHNKTRHPKYGTL